MKLSSQTITTPSGIETLHISGATHDNLPFVAFAAKVPRSQFVMSFAFEPTRKTMSQFVRDSGAACGLNGGFYTLDKGHPLDWLVIGGTTITGLTNPARPCIAVHQEGTVIRHPDTSLQPLHAIQAGPLLVQNGHVIRDYTDFKEKAAQFDSDITANRHPRSVFGLSPDHYWLLAVDGRSSASVGLYLEECAELIQQLGAIDAMNLDGGGSSMLVVGDKLLNNPRTWPNQPEPAERPIPTAILFHRA